MGQLPWKISLLGFGGWQLGGRRWGPFDLREGKRALHTALDLGVNFFDTAPTHGLGQSERLIGEAIASRPDLEVFVATKVPPLNGEWPARNGTPLSDAFTPAHVRSSVEESLRNLGRSHIDLLQLHVWLDEWRRDDELWETLGRLRDEGKIRQWGVSLNAGEPETGIGVARSRQVAAVQTVYNLFDQRARNSLLPTCREHRIGVIGRVPLDEGGLSGTLRSDTQFPEGDIRRSYFAGELLGETVRRVEWIRRELTGGEVPDVATCAVRFAISPPAISTVIVGMTRVAHVEANVRAVEAGPLPDALLAKTPGFEWVPRANQ
ncbi:aldo/keto reductase [Sorangium sp. So ce1128]